MLRPYVSLCLVGLLLAPQSASLKQLTSTATPAPKNLRSVWQVTTQESGYSAETRPAELHLSLSKLSDATPFEDGMFQDSLWEILSYIPNHEGRHLLNASAMGSQAQFNLPEGRYLIVVTGTFGKLRSFVDLAPGTTKRLSLLVPDF